jgi:alanine dehydrogenase
MKCPLCYDFLFEPANLSCDHIFCFLCLEKALIYDSRCPYCRNIISPEEKKLVLDKKTLDQDLANKIKEIVSEDDYIKRVKEAQTEEQKKIKTIRIEYGNYSEEMKTKPVLIKTIKVSQKYKWKLFVRVVSSVIPNPIQSVEFDINVGIKGSRPTVVTFPPYEMEKLGTYEFPVNIKINWRAGIKAKPYSVDYTIKLVPEKSTRQFLQYL